MKMDLALNNLKWLICRKTNQTNWGCEDDDDNDDDLSSFDCLIER